MTVTDTAAGKPGSSGAVPDAAEPTPRRELDAAVDDLRAHRDEWAGLPLDERIELLDALVADVRAVADRWVERSRRAEGLDADSPFLGEEWLAGPYVVLRNLRLLREALVDIRESGRPEIPGPVTERTDGQVVAEVFPASLWDRLFYPRVTAEVWMEPGVSREELDATRAVAYRDTASPATGRVALVLGAGNVTSIGPIRTVCSSAA